MRLEAGWLAAGAEALSGRFVVEVRPLALHAVEHPAQRRDLAFELGTALHQLGGVGQRIGDRIGGGKAEADLVAAAPGHARAHGVVLLRNVQIDHVRNADGFGEDDARADLGQIADQAAHGAAPLVEIDKAAQEAFQTSRIAELAPRLPPQPSTGKSKRKLTTAGLKPSYRWDFSRQYSGCAVL